MKIQVMVFVLVVVSSAAIYNAVRVDDEAGYVWLYKFQENNQNLERKSISIAMPFATNSPQVEVAGAPLEYSLLKSDGETRIKISPKHLSGIIKIRFKVDQKSSNLPALRDRFASTAVKSNNCGVLKKVLLDWPASTVRLPDKIIKVLNHGLHNFDKAISQDLPDDCSLSLQSLNASLWSEGVALGFAENFSYVSAYNPKKGVAIAANSLSSWFVFEVNGYWFGIPLNGIEPLEIVEVEDLLIVENEPLVAVGYNIWQL